MPSFADSFWSDDLTKGVETLFEQLHEGCLQNDLFIQLFASRMQHEVAHGQQLCNIKSGIDQFDEGRSTISKALHEIIGQMTVEGSQHINIASNIETTVLAPFSSWSDEHRKRVEYSEQKLKKHLDKFTKSRKQVEKLEQTYFNKCRTLEDFKRENFSEQELVAAMEALELHKAHSLTVAKEKEVLEFGTFASIAMDYRSTRQLLKALLVELPKKEYKVPFINYIIQNTNNGSEITKFIFERMKLTDLDQAEAFGQDLLNKGFLKYCNGVSSHFANSKKFQYQWKAYAYEFARLPKPGTDENEIDDEYGYVHARPVSETNRFSAYIQEMTSRITNGDSQSKTEKSIDNSVDSVESSEPQLTEQQRTLLKLRNEVEIADYNYRRECTKQDSLRCTMEELIIDHYTFMEKCEKDRLEAIKKATLDFCAALGNKISSMKIIVEKMITSESSMDPVRDILNLVETHRTGFFQPKVVPYNNYYNPGGYQNFGIDLETRCRLDKKVVPLIVSTILSYMDRIYPEMENDEERTKVWTMPVKLQETHRLRKLLNEKPAKSEAEILEMIKSSNPSPSLVTSVLKVYLLELPSPLIPDEIYDVMKSMYSEFPPAIAGATVHENQATIDSQRIKCITSTLSSLSKPRIATLDAITTHFYRLIKILKMSDSETSKSLADDLVINISQEFANCIIKIKQPDGNDLGYKIFFDLITHKKDVFRDLKRHGSRRKSENSSNSDAQS